MNEFCVNFQIQKTWNFVLACQKILEMFDNLMKFKYVSNTILTNFTNFDIFIQFIKIWAEGSFWKNLRKFQKKFHILVHIYFDILMHNCVQRSFISAACPGTHNDYFNKSLNSFFNFFKIFKKFFPNFDFF